MERKRKKLFIYSTFQLVIPSLLIGSLMVCPVGAEYVPGKNYDQSNYEEIADLLIPSVLKFVKSGEFLITPAEFPYEVKLNQPYLEASQKNKGKYVHDERGRIIEKDTGEFPEYIYGLPFPEVYGRTDIKDPDAAQKIVDNRAAMHERAGGFWTGGDAHWVGKGGLERSLYSGGIFLYYRQNARGPLANPSKFLDQKLINVYEPYDYRGTVTMRWDYIDDREAASWAYVPMLRRIRRMSAAASSDPFMGGDGSTDDQWCWGGVNSDMEWKFLGAKEFLMPWGRIQKLRVEILEDGSWLQPFPKSKLGFQVPGWQYAPWALADSVWIKRPVYMLEMNPKDKYYNYGRQILYIDVLSLTAHFKEIYSRAGEYWKTSLVTYNYAEDDNGIEYIGRPNSIQAVIDDKYRHATPYQNYGGPPGAKKTAANVPFRVVGPQNFTTSYLLQFSK